MISHVILRSTPESTVVDHETGRIIGTFDKNGLLNTKDVMENIAAPVIERLKKRFDIKSYVTEEEEEE